MHGDKRTKKKKEKAVRRTYADRRNPALRSKAAPVRFIARQIQEKRFAKQTANQRLRLVTRLEIVQEGYTVMTKR